MMKNSLKLIAFLMITISCFAQEKVLNGKVVSSDMVVPQALVVNLTKHIEVRTDNNGFFSLKADEGDIIAFSGEYVLTERIIVTRQVLETDVYIQNLDQKPYELDEIVITRHKDVDLVIMGIVPENRKRYTPAERRLYTGSSGIDGVINTINGKRKWLKKEIELEKYSETAERINYLYTEEDIIEQFKIPKEYAQGFIYYISEDKHVVETVKQKNNSYLKVLISALAAKYLEIIAGN